MSIEDILNRLKMPRANTLDLLRFHRDDTQDLAYWKADPRLHRAFARKLIESGQPTRAFELVREGLEAHPRDQELDYLGALALRRGGNTLRADEYTNKLLARADLQPKIRLEALSLAGSVEKQRLVRFIRSATQLDPQLARKSAELYLQALELARDRAHFPDPKEELFPEINAATMLFLAEEDERARGLARSVLELALPEVEKPENAANYWLKATIGEAMLLLNDLRGAAKWYGEGIRQAREANKEGDIASIRRNFQLLRYKIPLDDHEWGFFQIGNVVAFAGHMLDHAHQVDTGNYVPRFPNDPALIQLVEERIAAQLEELNARVGYCSLACGSDILFAERLLERRNPELHVILPFDRDDFYRTSVDFGLADDDAMKSWRSRCDNVIRRASQVHYATTEKYLGDDILFSFANAFIQGLAILRAEERGGDLLALAVLDPASSGNVRPGGTADFVQTWRARGLECRTINLAELREEVASTSWRPVPSRPYDADSDGVRRKIMVMLFADVKNFSKLDDVRYPSFFSTFLEVVKSVLEERSPAPSFVNTWGDGLYVVYEDVRDGADFALRLIDRVRKVDWPGLGLPEDTTVRIGVHAGPVYQRLDPIINRENVFGSQVNRAARIEPVTTPGCAFSSEQFAAALAIEVDHPFGCEYVGVEKLAKEYDRCPLYLLGRR